MHADTPQLFTIQRLVSVWGRVEVGYFDEIVVGVRRLSENSPATDAKGGIRRVALTVKNSDSTQKPLRGRPNSFLMKHGAWYWARVVVARMEEAVGKGVAQFALGCISGKETEGDAPMEANAKTKTAGKPNNVESTQGVWGDHDTTTVGVADDTAKRMYPAGNRNTSQIRPVPISHDPANRDGVPICWDFAPRSGCPRNAKCANAHGNFDNPTTEPLNCVGGIANSLGGG